MIEPATATQVLLKHGITSKKRKCQIAGSDGGGFSQALPRGRSTESRNSKSIASGSIARAESGRSSFDCGPADFKAGSEITDSYWRVEFASHEESSLINERITQEC